MLGFVAPLPASVTGYYSFTNNFANTGLVPDNDLNGWQDTREISGFQSGSQILDVNVTLDLSGGFNGDLYGSLVHANGFVVLLNHVGSTLGNPAGYSNPGLNFVFDQGALTDVHNYGTVAGVVAGTYRPDGTASPATSLNSFNTLDPNGAWTLYLQDNSFGDQSRVLGWGLQIEAVPEPTTTALGIFALLAGGLAAWRAWCPRLVAASRQSAAESVELLAGTDLIRVVSLECGDLSPLFPLGRPVAQSVSPAFQGTPTAFDPSAQGWRLRLP